MTPAASAAMTRSMSSKSSELAESYLPTAVMAYAVVLEPELVDNPDVPSYQPYVHGRCEPPALIPLQMHGAVAMEIDCCFDHANVCFSGAWRVHCIKASRKCDVRIAVPMGEQVIHADFVAYNLSISANEFYVNVFESEIKYFFFGKINFFFFMDIKIWKIYRFITNEMLEFPRPSNNNDCMGVLVEQFTGFS